MSAPAQVLGPNRKQPVPDRNRERMSRWCRYGIRDRSGRWCARCLGTDQWCREVHAGVRNHPPKYHRPIVIETGQPRSATATGAARRQAAAAAAAAAAYPADAAAAAEMASRVFWIARGAGMLTAACRPHLGMNGHGGMMDAGRTARRQEQYIDEGDDKQPCNHMHMLSDWPHSRAPSVLQIRPSTRPRDRLKQFEMIASFCPEGKPRFGAASPEFWHSLTRTGHASIPAGIGDAAAPSDRGGHRGQGSRIVLFTEF